MEGWRLECKVPPRIRGWPLVGESIQYALLGPQKFISERMEKYSANVFQTAQFGEKMAVFYGPEGNKMLFTKLVRSWWPLFVRKPLYFPDFDEGASMDEITAVFLSSINNILSPEALKEYILLMDHLAREHVESEWAGKEVLDVLRMSRKYTFGLSCRFFKNVVDDELVRKLAKYFDPVADGIYCVPFDLPDTAYNRAIKAGKLLREELMKLVTERKNAMLMENPSNNKSFTGQDYLSQLLLVTDGKGKYMSAKEICNNIIGLLFTSYETTSTVVTFVLKYLSELPHIYNKVYEEQMEIANSKEIVQSLKWEDVQKMKYSWNVVCEALRLMPAGQGTFRDAITDFKFAGITIQKGMKAYWTTYTTHYNPEYFHEPGKFDPSRFEGNRIAPFIFVPFGGGRRMCPGKEYARLEILVFLHNIVTKFRLENVSPRKLLHVFSAPMKGVSLRLIPHKK
nr:PREDICTED: beta-amyrin 28-oxidase-like [Daucus carota subsp. sativus]